MLYIYIYIYVIYIYIYIYIYKTHICKHIYTNSLFQYRMFHGLVTKFYPTVVIP